MNLREYVWNSVMYLYLVLKAMHHSKLEIGTYGAHFWCVSYLLFSLTVPIYFILDSNTFMLLIFAVFLGAIVVTFNIKVLGGKISYFQSVSILGYCICPIFIALIIVSILKFLQITNPIIRLVLIIVSTIWSILGIYIYYIILAARSFIGVNLPDHKKLVGLYPIIIFYSFIAVLMIFRWIYLCFIIYS